MRKKPKAKRFYADFLNEELQDTRFAVAYLNAAFEEKDERSFLVAVRNITQAHGIPMSELAKKTHINRVNLYKMLSKRGNPLLANVKTILQALGYRLFIGPLPAGDARMAKMA